MQITIYRGTHEIGGTLIELKTPDSRILLDAGYPLFLNGSPIDDKLAKLPPEDLLKLGVLPGISGLYSWDTPAFDAVIISHAHLDHYGLLKYVHPDIPVYMSTGTERLIRITVLFKIYADNPPACRTFKMYQPFKIGDFTIKPYLMDHSAFDAAAFEITAEGKTIIYTGDFRGHGRKAVCLDRFISGAIKQADLLLTEGTMFGRKDEEILTEEKLEAAALDLFSQSTGITLFQTSSQNIDRLVSFYKAAQKARKTLVVDVYTANVLYELRQLGNNHLPYRVVRGSENESGERTVAIEMMPQEFPCPFMFEEDTTYYNFERTDFLSDLVDRLIIDWGKSAISWHQKATNEKPVLAIQSNPRFVFAGYENVVLQYNELRDIVKDFTLYENWHTALSSVYAVYLIVDTQSGKQYVGSAYGTGGLLDRWSCYVDSKHGHDIGIIELMHDFPDRYQYFQFSILQILPKNITAEEVITIECLYKRKLLSKEFGMNRN